jgi:DNA-binding CsgD family transcriptional regulator
MASVMGVVHARMTGPEEGPLIELLGPLMGRIVQPYATDERTAYAEIRRGDELARAIQAGDPNWGPPPPGTPAEIQPALPAMLTNPTARRPRECLRFLAEHPDASNREIASAIGVNHKSQISRLLSQLHDEHLTLRHSDGAGSPNAWRLTARGEEIARALEHGGSQSPQRDFPDH